MRLPLKRGVNVFFILVLQYYENKIHIRLIVTPALLIVGCSAEGPSQFDRFNRVSMIDSIEGKAQYLQSPFVTAGDRVYMIGYQDGSFPDLGWHVEGEMGGIWNHPIKLMGGFYAEVTLQGTSRSYCLDEALSFVNYPFANRHYFQWIEENISIERTQFIPDSVEGAIIQFSVTNESEDRKDFSFSFTGMADLRPTWLGERTGMVDAEDELVFDDALSAAIGKDKNNPWYVAFGSSLPTDEFSLSSASCAPKQRKGLGKDATLKYTVSIDGRESVVIPIYIAGSYRSEDALRSNFDLLKAQADKLLKAKTARYESITNTAKLTIPDQGVQEMYQWLKYNTEWLVRSVPEQGTGLSAGLPDYPWWFGCDNTYALQAVLATGDHALVKETILLLNKISKQTNGNGRIIHEVSTNGSVYNPGNVNETAQFITLVWNYYAWTGDKTLVTQLYPDIKKGIDWLRKEKDPDHNGYPDGSGMMEIHGLDTEMIDVAAYTQQAYASAVHLAEAVGDSNSAHAYEKLADGLKMKINNDWWHPHHKSYGDFRATVAEARPVVAAALVRADTLQKPWAVAELELTARQLKEYPTDKKIPHLVYHNWVVNTPLETGIAAPDKAKQALKTLKKYENPFGVFVTGIDRTEEPDSVVLKSRRKIFSYTGAVMTLSTGVAAVAAARYRYPDESLQYIKKLENSFSYALPGSMYEVSPDFGMVTQAWNSYGVAVPIINYFFGIQPRAFDKTIVISPSMPSAWKEASLEDAVVGNNHLDLSIKTKEDHREIKITQTAPGWTIQLDTRGAKRIRVNGKEVQLGINQKTLNVTEQDVVIQLF